MYFISPNVYNYILLLQKKKKMLENGTQNDITIKLQDGEIKANKDVLMARSDYFSKMLNNDNFVEGMSRRSSWRRP